ncbi:MAG: epoxyqueuosine reductase QueH [Bacillota bacterium]|nr:epoxyqueuosine reductase QueH [Bacillota bacterium]
MTVIERAKPKLLLHCCCAPCAAGALPQFAGCGYQIEGFFYNPNIQPYTEQRARLESFERLMQERELPYSVDDGYPLDAWLRAALDEPQSRCRYCYRSRLQRSAEQAVRRGCQAFSTTLLISPYQQHQLIAEMAQEIGAKYGISFIYIDLRGGFRSGQQAARSAGLYMQKYCGCIFSELERYRKDKA